MLQGFASNQGPHCTSVFLFLPVCLLLEIKPRALHMQGTTLPLNTLSTPHFILTVLREALIISVHFTKEGETDLLQCESQQARGTCLWSHCKIQCRLMTALSQHVWEVWQALSTEAERRSVKPHPGLVISSFHLQLPVVSPRAQQWLSAWRTT